LLILLIEDEQVLRENLQELLEMYGYKCITAKNGIEGIVMTEQECPDLVLCDITMPDLDGYQVKAELDKQAWRPPFIFLTARTDKEDYARAKQVGAADFITKPFKIIDLVNWISCTLNQKN